MKLHRNSQKRQYQLDKIYFVVTKTFQNYPYFKEPIFCDLLIEELKICKKLKQFKLYAFSIIYDHLNLLIQPSDKFNISEVMQSIKKECSRDINYIINKSPEGDIPGCRLQGYQYSYRYNKKFIVPRLLNLCSQFIKKYKHNQNAFPKFHWQKSFRDHIIRNGRDFKNHYNYTIYNFQKHNLPTSWKYTSLNYHDLADHPDFWLFEI